MLKDLIALRLRTGGVIHFEAKADAVEDVGTEAPQIRFTTKDGQKQVLRVRLMIPAFDAP